MSCFVLGCSHCDGSTDLSAVDASSHFSSRILPYVERLLSGQDTDDDIAATLNRAKIVDGGQITADHSWLAPRVEAWRNTKTATPSQSSVPTRLPPKKKRVLLLGSGLVAGPAVDVLEHRGDIELVIGKADSARPNETVTDLEASNNVGEAELLASGRRDVSVLGLDVSDQHRLGEAVAAADVVVRCVVP